MLGVYRKSLIRKHYLMCHPNQNRALNPMSECASHGLTKTHEDQCLATNSQMSSISALLPYEMAAHLTDSVRRRICNPISWPSPRKRSESISSTTSDGSCSTTLVNTGTSTPRLCPQGAPAQQLSMATLSMSTNALSALPDETLSKQGEKAAVNWPAVAVGVNLSQTALKGHASMDPAVGRTMLIDGLKYMIGALPEDLTEREVGVLREFLPVSRLPVDSAGGLVPGNQVTGAKAGSDNVLRSGTARMVCFFISVLVLVVPILASLLSRALDYERQHRLAERTIQGTGQLAKNAASVSVSAADSLINLGQSPSGSQCLDSTRWIFQSIIEGAGDGFHESTRRRDLQPPLDSLRMLL